MKKIQTVLLTLLVACTGMAVQSCSNDDDIKLRVYYACDVSGLQVVLGQESKGSAFVSELNTAVGSLQDETVTDAKVIQKVQTIVDKYNNDAIFGTLLLKSGSLPSLENMSTIKTFVMTLNPQYNVQQ